MAQPLTDKEIILALGGPAALTGLGYTEMAIQKWMNADRGIPWKARIQIVGLAAKHKKRLPKDFLHVQRKPAQAQA